MIISSEFGHHLLGDEPVVFHCHHYNTTLQQIILSADYLNISDYLKRASAEILYPIFLTMFYEAEQLEKLNLITNLCKNLGFGTLHFTEATESGGTAISTTSHYSLGWKSKFGLAEEPVDYFLCGVIQAGFSAIFNSEYTVDQVSCIAMGHNENSYQIKKINDTVSLKDTSPKNAPHILAPEDTFTSSISSTEITDAVKGLELTGNEDGIIDAFGVYLTHMFGNYYNRIGFLFEKRLLEEGSFPEICEELMIEAGHNCGFYTMGNIMKSPEFDVLVASKTEDPRDWLHGIVSVINALGWGQWRIVDLVEDKSFTLRVYNSYEAIGYRNLHGTSSKCQCHMVKGVSSALMNLLYLGDIQKKPELTSDFYKNLFNRDDSFKAKEIKCFAMGNTSYCEFLIEKY